MIFSGMLSDEEEYYVDEKELEKVTKSSINPVLLAKRKRIEASRCRGGKFYFLNYVIIK